MLLGTDGIKDSVPLKWRDQVITRVGVEKSWLERAVVRTDYAHSSDIVQGATLSPLTAAIARHTLSAGVGYSFGRYRFDLGYTIDQAWNGVCGRAR